MLLSWDDLKVLLAVSRAGSLTGAASSLGIDQSTVGRRISALEASVGAILFVRSKTGFTPTAAGDVVVARAIEIESRAIRLAEEVANVSDGPVGLVRVVGNAWTVARLVERAVPTLLARHPKLDLRTISGPQARSLGRGEAVLALWFEQSPRESEFAVKLGDVPYAVYASADVDPDELGWISFWDDQAPRWAPTRWIERERKPGQSLRLTSTDTVVLRAGIKAGIGKGLLPMCMAEGDPGLVRITKGNPDLVRTLHLHAHPDTIQTTRIQVTMAWLRETFDTVFLPNG